MSNSDEHDKAINSLDIGQVIYIHNPMINSEEVNSHDAYWGKNVVDNAMRSPRNSSCVNRSIQRENYESNCERVTEKCTKISHLPYQPVKLCQTNSSQIFKYIIGNNSAITSNPDEVNNTSESIGWTVDTELTRDEKANSLGIGQVICIPWNSSCVNKSIQQEKFESNSEYYVTDSSVDEEKCAKISHLPYQPVKLCQTNSSQIFKYIIGNNSAITSNPDEVNNTSESIGWTVDTELTRDEKANSLGVGQVICIPWNSSCVNKSIQQEKFESNSEYYVTDSSVDEEKCAKNKHLPHQPVKLNQTNSSQIFKYIVGDNSEITSNPDEVNNASESIGWTEDTELTRNEKANSLDIGQVIYIPWNSSCVNKSIQQEKFESNSDYVKDLSVDKEKCAKVTQDISDGDEDEEDLISIIDVEEDEEEFLSDVDDALPEIDPHFEATQDISGGDEDEEDEDEEDEDEEDEDEEDEDEEDEDEEDEDEEDEDEEDEEGITNVEEDEGEFLSDVDDDVPDIDVPYVVCDALASVIGFTENVNDINSDMNSSQSNEPIELQSLNIIKKVQVGSCDNSKMFVQTSDFPQKDKKPCCPYCQKPQTKLPRHMETVHKTEEDVIKFRSLPKGSHERRTFLDTLRKKGNLIWNTDSKLNKGLLITCRRPQKRLGKTASGFNTCAKCLGSYSIKGRHFSRCLKSRVKGEHLSMKLGRAVEGRIDANANNRLRLVFPVLRNDAVVQIIRYDWLLIVHGNRLCVKYTKHFQDNLIRARLRLAGRLLLHLKVINPQVTDFASIYQPKMYDSVIEAVKQVGRLNENTGLYGAPATASSAVTLLRKIGFSIKFELIKKEDDVNLSKAEKFLILLEDAGTSVLKAVADSQAQMRREKKEIIPTDEDVKKLVNYLERERVQCLDELSLRYSFKNFVKLSELVMISIIVFNRRRTGETQNILMSDFFGRESINENSNAQLYSELSQRERELVEKYSRMTIRGKLGRPVPVLLEPDITNCIDVLIRYRGKVGISSQNEYLFGLPSSNELQTKVVKPCEAMRKFALACQAENPETLRGTSLRKHIASKCISMDLNDNDMSDFAIFLGHHLKIHREYYRINGIQRDIVKMGELLESVQGKIASCKNLNNLDSDPKIDIVGGNTSSSEAHGAYTEFEDSTSFLNIEAESSDSESSVEISTKAKKTRKRKYSSSDDNDDVSETKKIQKIKFPKKRWTDQEVSAVRKAFTKYFASKTLPSTQEILEQQRLIKSLQKRTWQQIKTYISNQNKKP